MLPSHPQPPVPTRSERQETLRARQQAASAAYSAPSFEKLPEGSAAVSFEAYRAARASGGRATPADRPATLGGAEGAAPRGVGPYRHSELPGTRAREEFSRQHSRALEENPSAFHRSLNECSYEIERLVDGGYLPRK